MLLKLRGLRIPLLILSIVYIFVTVVLPTVTIFLVGWLKTYGISFTLENMTPANFKYILFTMEDDEGCHLEQLLSLPRPQPL